GTARFLSSPISPISFRTRNFPIESRIHRLEPISVTFDYEATVPLAHLSQRERSDRARLRTIRVRGTDLGNCNPLTRNGRKAPIRTSPHRKSGLPDLRTILRNPGRPGMRGEVQLPARSQRITR